MKDALIVSLLSVVPKHTTARGMGIFSRISLPRFLHRLLVRWFVKKYKVDLSECQGTIDDFPNLARFFIRELKPGVRPVDQTPSALVSPVDGRGHTFGLIKDGRFQQSEDRQGTVANLLGADLIAATPALDPARFEGGAFAVIYLSPQDYHRVHSPREGTIASVRYLPGTLWPVFPAATRRVEHLFDRNERMVFQIETDAGTIVLAMIGAFGVGRMASPHTDVVTNTGGAATDERGGIAVERAGELGRFEMGSTVVLLAEPGRLTWALQPGQVTRLGRPIGTVQVG